MQAWKHQKNPNVQILKIFFYGNNVNSFLVLTIHFQGKKSLFWHTEPKVMFFFSEKKPVIK